LGHNHSPENESQRGEVATFSGTRIRRLESAHESEGQPVPFPSQPPDTAGPGNTSTSAHVVYQYQPRFVGLYSPGHPRHKEDRYELNPFAPCDHSEPTMGCRSCTICHHDLPIVKCGICFPVPRCLHNWPLIRCHHCRSCITCSGAVSGRDLWYNGPTAVCTSNNPPGQEMLLRDVERILALGL